MLMLVRLGIAVALWTLSVLLMIVRSVDPNDPTLAPLTGWAILVGIWAGIITGWAILVHERARCEAMAVAAAEAAAEAVSAQHAGLRPC